MRAADEDKPPFVLLRRFIYGADALVAKSVLDSANIECVLSDANTIRMDWAYSNLVGGVKLWARENEAEEGLALLDQQVPEKFEVEGQMEFTQPRCPKCQSYEVSHRELFKLPTFLATFLLSIPIAIHRRNWKCHNCGNIWK
jgi:hypothetical protein